MDYILSICGNRKITLPKKWRGRFDVQKFFTRSKKGRFIKKEVLPEGVKDENVELYEYEEDERHVSGIHFKKGLGRDGMKYLIDSLKKDV